MQSARTWDSITLFDDYAPAKVEGVVLEHFGNVAIDSAKDRFASAGRPGRNKAGRV
jgi:hypothetical protein